MCSCKQPVTCPIQIRTAVHKTNSRLVKRGNSTTISHLRQILEVAVSDLRVVNRVVAFREVFLGEPGGVGQRDGGQQLVLLRLVIQDLPFLRSGAFRRHKTATLELKTLESLHHSNFFCEQEIFWSKQAEISQPCQSAKAFQLVLDVRRQDSRPDRVVSRVPKSARRHVHPPHIACLPRQEFSPRSPGVYLALPAHRTEPGGDGRRLRQELEAPAAVGVAHA